MVSVHNFAPGNAGIIFPTDIFIPQFGLALLWLSSRDANSKAAMIRA